jgi:hypothetical protein
LQNAWLIVLKRRKRRCEFSMSKIHKEKFGADEIIRPRCIASARLQMLVGIVCSNDKAGLVWSSDMTGLV